MAVGDVQWELGSPTLSTSRGETVTVRWGLGSVFVLHEYPAVVVLAPVSSITASLNASTIFAGRRTAAPLLSTVVTVNAPTAVPSASHAPAVLAATASVIAPTVVIDASYVASALSIVATVNAPTAVPGAAYAPAVLTVTASMIAPTFAVELDYPASMLPIVASVNVPTAVPGAAYSPATLTATASLLAPAVVIDMTYPAPVLSVEASLNAPRSHLISLHPDGRRGIGVAQGLTGSNYPLLANAPPSLDIRYLLADLWLAYDDPADYALPAGSVRPFTLPFKIGYMYGFGTGGGGTKPAWAANAVNAREMVILDANDNVVIDTALDEGSSHPTIYYRRDWADRLEIVGWEKQNAVLFAVVHTQWPDPPHHLITPVIYKEHLVPVNAILDERTWQRRPKRVRSLTMVLDTAAEEPVEFAEGYNTQLALSDEIVEGGRIKRQITFAAASGGGSGVYPGCQPQPLLITKINDIAPDEIGDFFLTATDCYWVRRDADVVDVNVGTPSEKRVGELEPGILRIGNDCWPCCECDRFVVTAQYMHRIRNQYGVTGRDAERIRSLYHENRNRWNAGKCCFDQHLLRFRMQPQLCPHIDILAQYSNWTDECVGPLRLLINFAKTPSVSINQIVVQPRGVIVPGFTYCHGKTRAEFRRGSQTERCSLRGIWPCFEITFTEIEPYQSVWVKARLRFGNCGVDDSLNPFTIKGCLRAILDGVPLTQPCGSSSSLSAWHCSESSSSSSLSSLSSMSPLSTGWAHFEICKTVELRCPPKPEDVYDYTRCFD